MNHLAAEFALSGRVAVVTGAASGIGREVARTLAEAGAATVLADLDADGLEETAHLVRGLGQDALVHRVDVRDRAAVDTLGDAAYGLRERVDVWVNCAGAILTRPILEMSEDELERILAINLKGTVWGCAAAGRMMQRRGAGSIVNFSSAGADIPAPGLSAYAMAKAAVNMLTRTLAKELGPDGIRANAVAPGWVETPLALHSIRDANGSIDPAARTRLLASRAEGSPLGLTGSPRDIALAVLYLASDASRFMTGQVLRPNGGVVMP